MGVFSGGILVVLLLGAYCIWDVRRAYRMGRVFEAHTVAAVWVVYLLHGALTIGAAWRSVWPLPLDAVTAVTAGSALVAGGLALALAGSVEFGSVRRMSGMIENKVVCSGVYRWSRNPQNVGWELAFLGTALLGRSGFALLLAALFWAMFLAYLPAEEKHLERVFGDEYRAYRSRTARFLGRPSVRRDGQGGIDQ